MTAGLYIVKAVSRAVHSVLCVCVCVCARVCCCCILSRACQAPQQPVSQSAAGAEWARITQRAICVALPPSLSASHCLPACLDARPRLALLFRFQNVCFFPPSLNILQLTHRIISRIRFLKIDKRQNWQNTDFEK